MTAIERLRLELSELPEQEREGVAERLLLELRRTRRAEVIAKVDHVEGAPSPKNEAQLRALLDEGMADLERGELTSIEDLNFVEDFKRRHGLTKL